MKEKCQKKEWRGKCCCSCKYHLKDMSHPTTDGKRCVKQRGWVCAPPEMNGVFSGWTKHGLCEMWESASRLGPEPPVKEQ
jgi:hypothetical protein